VIIYKQNKLLFINVTVTSSAVTRGEFKAPHC